jgi:hypothetical protein
MRTQAYTTPSMATPTATPTAGRAHPLLGDLALRPVRGREPLQAWTEPPVADVSRRRVPMLPAAIS